MDDKRTRLMKRFVPKLTGPQVRALRMLAEKPYAGAGDWRDGAIQQTCGFCLVGHNLASQSTTRDGYRYTHTFTITELGRTWLELQEAL